MAKQVISSLVKDDKRVIRWQHHLPTECLCCTEPAKYSCFIPDSNTHIGARMILLCQKHFTELCETHTVEPVHDKHVPERYPYVKSSLGSVIRDTDPGAMSTDAWMEKLHPKGKKKDPTHKPVSAPVVQVKPSAGILALVKKKVPPATS